MVSADGMSRSELCNGLFFLFFFGGREKVGIGPDFCCCCLCVCLCGWGGGGGGGGVKKKKEKEKKTGGGRCTLPRKLGVVRHRVYFYRKLWKDK